eukprot:PhM_4_TR18458/c0_g1_i2/m.34344
MLYAAVVAVLACVLPERLQRVAIELLLKQIKRLVVRCELRKEVSLAPRAPRVDVVDDAAVEDLDRLARERALNNKTCVLVAAHIRAVRTADPRNMDTARLRWTEDLPCFELTGADDADGAIPRRDANIHGEVVEDLVRASGVGDALDHLQPGLGGVQRGLLDAPVRIPNRNDAVGVNAVDGAALEDDAALHQIQHLAVPVGDAIDGLGVGEVNTVEWGHVQRQHHDLADAQPDRRLCNDALQLRGVSGLVQRDEVDWARDLRLDLRRERLAAITEALLLLPNLKQRLHSLRQPLREQDVRDVRRQGTHRCDTALQHNFGVHEGDVYLGVGRLHGAGVQVKQREALRVLVVPPHGGLNGRDAAPALCLLLAVVSQRADDVDAGEHHPSGAEHKVRHKAIFDVAGFG